MKLHCYVTGFECAKCKGNKGLVRKVDLVLQVGVLQCEECGELQIVQPNPVAG